MSLSPNVLFFDAGPIKTAKVRSLLQDKGLASDCVELWRSPGDETLRRTDVAVIITDQEAADSTANEISTLVQKLAKENIATVVWGAPDKPRHAGPLVDYIPLDVSLDEVVGRLTMAARYAPVVKRLDREIHHLQRLGQQLNRYFSAIDQEMRLAGRLQRDFLPRSLPHVPPLAFATLYRPASWVSGDMFDVFRIDERHVGILVADAMGHGIAAGLLTMFLRQALATKTVDGAGYTIVNPKDAMKTLHECLIRQKLPNCQFVTAVYAIVDLTRLELRLARGGHPYPILITKDGELRELTCDGPLLGLTDMLPEFGEHREQLNRGDKVVFFSDGAEHAFYEPATESNGGPEFTERVRRWAELGADAFVEALGEYLDHEEGSLHPSDDVTVVVLEVA